MTFHKYPKIVRFGEKETALLLEDPDNIIYIEEKIDGANFRFMPTEDGRIIFGSRTQSIGDNTNDGERKTWKRCIDFILSTIDGKDLTPYQGFIFYGECCIPHSIRYDWDNMPAFLGFDIMHDDTFLDFNNKRAIYADLGLPIVPAIASYTSAEIKEIVLSEASIPLSAYGEGLKAEGIVLKNYRTQTFVKFVSTKFKEVNKDTFGANKKFAADDDERLIATYCTNPRIDKQIFKLVNDGEELSIKLMQFLPKLVWEDIVEEHSGEILNQNWKLDLRACRKAVSQRSKSVLEQVIQLQVFT